MENWCWNIRKIKKTGQGLSEELGKYIWLAKAGTSQEAPASKSGSSSLIVTNYSSLRKDLKKYCDKVIDDWEAIIITRKNDKNVVLMSLIVW